MSPTPFWRAIRRLSSMKVLPLTNVTYTQDDHFACSAKAFSPGTQSRIPMSQWKQVTLSKLPVMTKCLMRVKMFLTKLLVGGKKFSFVQWCICTSKKEACLCQIFGWWHSLLMCPRVERFESRIKQVVGRVCKRCPTLCSPQLYVLFEAILQTLPVILKLLSALVYES